MQKKIVWLLLIGLVIQFMSMSGVAQEQEVEPLSERKGGFPFFIAPVDTQIIDISQAALVNMQRKNESYKFHISVAQGITTEQSYKVIISHLAQDEKGIGRGQLEPETETYNVQAQDIEQPEALLKNLAQKAWGDESFYYVLAWFNGLRQEYTLSSEIVIPEVQEPYQILDENELLSGISTSAYGDPELASFLAEMNGMVRPYQLMRNMWLFVPKLSEQTHTVETGQTWEEISNLVYGSSAVAHYLRLLNDATDRAPAIGAKVRLPEIKKIIPREENTQIPVLALQNYGSEQGFVLLVRANNLQQKYALVLDQVIVSPVFEREQYVVQAGEDLPTIAYKLYEDTNGWGLLTILNNKRTVSQGDRLWVPKVKEHLYSCAGWIEPLEPEFTLSTESKRLEMQLRIPPNIRSGTYSALIGVMPVMERRILGGGSIVTQAIPVYSTSWVFNIQGRRATPLSGTLHAVRSRAGKFQGEECTHVEIGLKNLGENLIEVRSGTIMILRPGNEGSRGRNSVSPQRRFGGPGDFVLPGGECFIRAVYIPPLPLGDLIAVVKIDIGARRQLFQELPFTLGGSGEISVRKAVSFSIETGNEENILFFEGLRPGFIGRGYQSFKVINDEWQNKLHFEISIEDLPGLEKEAQQKYQARDSEGNSLFLIPERDLSFELAPRATKNIRLMLRDPEVQEFPRYGRIRIKASLISKEGEQQAELLEAERFIDVFETSLAKPKYALSGYHEQTIFSPEGKLILKLQVKNEGTIHLLPAVQMRIIDQYEQVVVLEEAKVSDYIFPLEEREFSPQIDLVERESIQPGLHKVQLVFEEKDKELLTIESQFFVPENFRDFLEQEQEFILPEGEDGEIMPIDSLPGLGPGSTSEEERSHE